MVEDKKCAASSDNTAKPKVSLKSDSGKVEMNLSTGEFKLSS